MNAPILWIGIPIVAAILLYTARRWKFITLTAGVIFSVVLALAAWKLPIGIFTKIGPWNIKLDSTFVVFGRRLDLVDTDRPLLVMIYLGIAFWFGGITAARAGRLSIPLGLLVVALLTAALAVEPFLYAALLIEMAVLVCVPILSPPGYSAGRGSLRFLVFQTFGMPFILFTGYLLAGIEANPGDPILLTRVSLLMGFGFSFLLAIFPFHSWMPMLGEEAHPYTTAFVFATLPEMVMLFGLNFLDRFAWMRESETIFNVIIAIGVLMIVSGGMWAAFQHHLGRILAFSMMVEIGFSILCVGMLQNNPQGLLLHFALLPPRFLALGAWSLSLSILKSKQNDLTLPSVKGLARRMPIATAGIVIGQLSLAGLPILAGFPVRWAIWDYLAQQTPWAALWSVLGSIGIFIACFRTMVVLLSRPVTQESNQSNRWQITETWSQILLVCLGLIALFLMGFLPQQILTFLAPLPRAFEHLFP